MVLRVGLVGRGRWGGNIERTLLSLPGVSVVPLARGVRRPTGLDAVAVATTSASHAEMAVPYIEAGIATFVEKPMATSLADCTRIADAARRSGAVVFVGHVYLYHPAFTTALKLLPDLGAVRHLTCIGMNDNPRSDSSVLWDWLPHDLSMAHAIFGCGPDRVACRHVSGDVIPQAAVAEFRYGDATARCEVSWLSPQRRRQVTIECEGGQLKLDAYASPALTMRTRNGNEQAVPVDQSELPLTLELQAFLHAVRTGQPDPLQITMGASVVRSIVAAERSMAAGSELQV